jgi:hypothetical protein
MAIPLNEFRTVTADLTTATETIYTTPANVAATIVLLAQATNVNNETRNVTLSTSYNNTELVKDFPISQSDAASLISGKLVLASGESLLASASANNTIKLTVSVLETR